MVEEGKLEEIFNEMEYKNISIAEEVTILNYGVYKGYEYHILNLGTHPCSYITLTKDDKLFGKTLDELDETDVYCHGGFNYADNTLSSRTYSYVNKYEDKWIIGYDYGHYKDWTGYMSDEHNIMLGNKKWTTNELREEVREVIEQLIEYNRRDDL